MTLPHLLQIIALLGLGWLFIMGVALIAGARADRKMRESFREWQWRIK
jgi:hypothetical protein